MDNPSLMAVPETWRYKHACDGCGTGYGFCLPGWTFNLMCCKNCNHPGLESTNPPYTPEEIAEMTRGKSEQPA